MLLYSVLLKIFGLFVVSAKTHGLPAVSSGDRAVLQGCHNGMLQLYGDIRGV
jgi:hypothetical protein